MFKKINKFSKLAFVFTVLYILLGIFIMSNIYSFIPYYVSQIVFYFYLGFMIVSVVMGIMAFMQTNKAEEKTKEKWTIAILTLINIFVIVLNIIAVIIYPQTF